MESAEVPGFKPGDKVDIIICNAFLSGEIVSRSLENSKEWIIRTYFHNKLIVLDESHIYSRQREEYFRKLFQKGTVVFFENGNIQSIGIIIDSVTEIIEQESIYIPIVLFGDEKRMISPTHLSVA